MALINNCCYHLLKRAFIVFLVKLMFFLFWVPQWLDFLLVNQLTQITSRSYSTAQSCTHFLPSTPLSMQGGLLDWHYATVNEEINAKVDATEGRSNEVQETVEIFATKSNGRKRTRSPETWKTKHVKKPGLRRNSPRIVLSHVLYVWNIFLQLIWWKIWDPLLWRTGHISFCPNW